jgi:tRNA-Thr(GGU) m(6)t(6)A37 methyltransferase TsaA
MNSIAMTPVGVVRSTRSKPEDDRWDMERARVELDPAQFSAEALAGLAEFSHVEIVFFMDRVDPETVERASRHPRNHADWPKVGIFAQRGKNRPNRIGVTICKILNVKGLGVQVEGLDAIDGTPVLDIKPWVAEFGPRGPVRQPKWISELMRGYWGE